MQRLYGTRVNIDTTAPISPTGEDAPDFFAQDFPTAGDTIEVPPMHTSASANSLNNEAASLAGERKT